MNFNFQEKGSIFQKYFYQPPQPRIFEDFRKQLRNQRNLIIDMHYLNMYCHISLFNYPVFKKVIPINFGEHMLKFCECEFNATTYAVVFIMQVFF